MKNANNLDTTLDAVERTNALAMELLQKERVAIFIVAYNEIGRASCRERV